VTASPGAPSTAGKQLVVPRIVDRELWTRAAPNGVAFLVPDEGPLGLGIVFEDAEAGLEIFERWTRELGAADTDELIRVTISEGDGPDGGPGYAVTIEVDVDSIGDALAGEDFDGTDIEVDGLGLVRWRMAAPPEGSPHLAAWKRRLAEAKVYALVPVIDDGDGLEPIYELQLVKRKLVFAPVPPDDADDDMAVTLDRLVRWSEQLCILPPLDYARAMAELGITGAITPRSRSYATVEPAPPGTKWLALALEHLGPNAGSLSGVELAPTASITRGELDRELGAGEGAPVIDGGGEHEVGYRVEIAGAPYTCSVFARFPGVPSDDSPTGTVHLRRDPVTPRSTQEPR
jgi:hypothetical protein